MHKIFFKYIFDKSLSQFCFQTKQFKCYLSLFCFFFNRFILAAISSFLLDTLLPRKTSSSIRFLAFNMPGFLNNFWMLNNYTLLPLDMALSLTKPYKAFEIVLQKLSLILLLFSLKAWPVTKSFAKLLFNLVCTIRG